jgi:hypothetical protein
LKFGDFDSGYRIVVSGHRRSWSPVAASVRGEGRREEEREGEIFLKWGRKKKKET